MKIDNSPARGTRDLLPAAVALRDHVLAAITEVYGRYGYQRIDTPCVENIDRLRGGEGGENEKLIFQILRRGLEDVEPGTSLADLVDLGLRFDLTVPLTRFYANNHATPPAPFRSFQFGPVWRAERPQRGRYRQFYQCDIDLLGEESVLAEVELIEATTRRTSTQWTARRVIHCARCCGPPPDLSQDTRPTRGVKASAGTPQRSPPESSASTKGSTTPLTGAINPQSSLSVRIRSSRPSSSDAVIRHKRHFAVDRVTLDGKDLAPPGRRSPRSTTRLARTHRRWPWFSSAYDAAAQSVLSRSGTVQVPGSGPSRRRRSRR